jgi:predicted nuclease with RNAse H fold
MHAARHRVVGIDVGGTTKGFHAVALRDGRLLDKLNTKNAAHIVAWCREQGAGAVGIDAPCQWSMTGRARPCEREIARLGIPAFSTPSAIIGEVHPFYRWMVNGIALYRQLVSYYRLYDGGSRFSHPVCFETFPQAIACALAGKRLSAQNKRMDRRRILERAGIAEPLTSIDEVDAALCALSAQHVLAGRFTSYGDAAEGFILVPAVQNGERIL